MGRGNAGERRGGRSQEVGGNASVAPQLVLVGAEPRVDLLPSEVHVHRRERAAIRRAWLAVVVVAALVIAATAGAAAESVHSRVDLATANTETNALASQQGQFTDLRDVEQQTALREAAQTVGGSTEINWSDLLHRVANSLPAGVTITSLSIDAANATTPYTQATTPLQGQRVATIQLQAVSASVPAVPTWLDAVKELPGYVDANAGSVTQASGAGEYTVALTIHVGEKAYDGRYAADKTGGE
ncbi:hypothetical protein DEI82_12155 [Curtobacterium sp. MCBD17_019]|nr:hypothetical protein DEI82_12155 [Curtobacterium sp. MCBD17_019]